MGIVLYLSSVLVAVGVAVATILRVRAAGTSGWLIGWLVLPAFATLFMIKLRCLPGGSYPCGFMSFTGGFTWHWVLGAAVFLGGWGLGGRLLTAVRPIAWRDWMEKLGRGMAPLLGLWLAVVWETLPIGIIHPPSHGGPCPDLPVICHDIPVLGWGGLLYWTVPFGFWAVSTLCADLRRASRT